MAEVESAGARAFRDARDAGASYVDAGHAADHAEREHQRAVRAAHRNPSRLDAIAHLVGSAENLHGEYCATPSFDDCCAQPTVDALHVLGVTDAEIVAARQRRERDISEYYRQQREEVSHRG